MPGRGGGGDYRRRRGDAFTALSFAVKCYTGNRPNGGWAGPPVGRRPAQRVGDDQQLHEVFVHRRAGRLDDEDVLPADAFLDSHSHLAVGKMEDAHLGQGDVQRGRNLLRQRGVPGSGEQLQAPATGRPGADRAFHLDEVCRLHDVTAEDWP